MLTYPVSVSARLSFFLGKLEIYLIIGKVGLWSGTELAGRRSSPNVKAKSMTTKITPSIWQMPELT
jgi:hypothetical protein